MYQNYFNLKAKPFSISPDSRFLWLGEKHREGLATLKYGIMENKGFLALTGEVGTGKTLLINALIKITGVKALIASIPDPDLETMDFFNLLADEFNMNKVFSSKGDFLIEFKKFLIESYASEKAVLLIIDEAQRLNHKLLEQIRMLSNIELDNRKLINIFFVGQSEFNRMLVDPENRAVRQRLAVNYRLGPLTREETAEYIQHRLKLAGAAEEIFSPGAVRNVYSFSKGCPRLINIICDHALLTGFATGLKKINTGTIKLCEKELQIPASSSITYEEAPTEGDDRLPFNLSGLRPKQQSSFMYGAAFIVMLFFVFIGFQIHGSMMENSPRLKVEDYGPQKKLEFSKDRWGGLKTESEIEADKL